MSNNIAFYRIKHGLTQKQLAEKIGIAIHAVGYAENHRCSANLATKIGAVLGESPFDIIGSDLFRIMPTNEAEKELVVKIAKELQYV